MAYDSIHLTTSDDADIADDGAAMSDCPEHERRREAMHGVGVEKRNFEDLVATLLSCCSCLSCRKGACDTLHSHLGWYRTNCDCHPDLYK